MPNLIVYTEFTYHTKTPTGKLLRASRLLKYSDEDEWELTVYDSGLQPLREFYGWDEVRVLRFMESYDEYSHDITLEESSFSVGVYRGHLSRYRRARSPVFSRGWYRRLCDACRPYSSSSSS